MTRLTTRAGIIEGVTLDRGIERFFGIPFAEAPIGALRFREAVPRAAWRGIRDATRPGPTSPQEEVTNPLHRRLAAPGWIRGDDVLNLNVWTPNRAGSAPVAVWIYGGAFKEGGGTLPLYDGSAFARDGIVAISLNYRVAADGFALFDGYPRNLGLRDQVAALRWVQENIADFGGDPSRVTIYGQSAGGASVAHLVSSPLAHGLFQRAINQSGPMHLSISAEESLATTAAIAARLGVAATPEGFSSVTEEALLAATLDLTGHPSGAVIPATRRMSVVEDPDFPIGGGAAARFADPSVPVLAGYTSDEFGLFGFPDPVLNRLEAATQLKDVVDDPSAYIEKLHTAIPNLPFGTLVRKTLEQDLFVSGILGWLEDARSVGVSAWGYEFAWRTAAFGGAPGAFHNLEEPFTFDLLNREHITDMTGPNPPQTLADEMHSDWVTFMHDGTLQRPMADGSVGGQHRYTGGQDDRHNLTEEVRDVFLAHSLRHSKVESV